MSIRSAVLGLVAHVVRTARAFGMQRVWLYVPEDSPIAKRLYKSAGFGASGRVANYYPPQGSVSNEFTVDALIMNLCVPST